MLSDLNFTWRACGVAAAIVFVVLRLRGPRRKDPSGSSRPSFLGRVGGYIMSHAVISTITGFLGFNIIIAVFSILLAIPLLLMGARVDLPESVKAWPRSLVAGVKEAFIDKKEAVAEKLRDAKAAVIRKVTGRKDAPVDSDEFWGGPPDPNASEETIRNERLMFDALPPDVKIAAFEAAKPIDTAELEDVSAVYFPTQWYKVRTGRSTFVRTTLPRIEMYKILWTADKYGAHGMDPKARTHLTRVSPPRTPNPPAECATNFRQMRPAECFAVYMAAWKLKRPLPDDFNEPQGHTRDEQFFQVRCCCCRSWILTDKDLESLKDAAFEAMQQEEAVAAAERRDRPARLARAARDRAEEGVKELAKTARNKAGMVASDLKDKAEEGVKEGAKGLFWKALGY